MQPLSSTLTEISANDLNNKILADNITHGSLDSYICKEPFFLDLHRPQKVIFTNSHFEDVVYISNDSNESDFQFFNCIFKEKIEIGTLRENSNLAFSTCRLNNGMAMHEISTITFSMVRCSLNGEFAFDGSTFESCYFSKTLFDDCDSYSSITFLGCQFEKINFTEAVLQNPSFISSIFNDSARFKGCTFNHTGLIGVGSFMGSKFKMDADFRDAKFKLFASFNNAVFMGYAYFTGCNLGELYCSSDFSGAGFEKRVFFDNSWFRNLEIHHAEFKEVVSFKNIVCGNLNLNKCLFVQGADFLDAEIRGATRESFRIIKNEFLKSNNSVDALIYQAKELREIEKATSWQYPVEKSVLWFNKISNDFGTNWVKGFLFTWRISIIFYIIYFLSLHNPPGAWGWKGWLSFMSAVNETSKYYFKFLIVTHDLAFMDKSGPNAFSYFIDSFGRIFIAYGIVQTVQAFRKFVK